MAQEDWHVAHVNIAVLKAPLDSPQLAGFVQMLAPVNALADGAPGFVWRLQTESGDATAIRAFGDDRIIVNLTVWRSVEDLARPRVREPTRRGPPASSRVVREDGRGAPRALVAPGRHDPDGRGG